MATAPAEDQSAVSDIHPLLRQRMLSRAATFTEGAQHPSPPLPRRRSSVYSNTAHSIRSSTDNLLRTSGNNDMDKLTNTDEPSFWHSAPLAFAIVPAFAGLLFQNGGAVVTDILLLGFGSMFLNWCLRTPWSVDSASDGALLMFQGSGITQRNRLNTSSPTTKNTTVRFLKKMKRASGQKRTILSPGHQPRQLPRTALPREKKRPLWPRKQGSVTRIGN